MLRKLLEDRLRRLQALLVLLRLVEFLRESQQRVRRGSSKKRVVTLTTIERKIPDSLAGRVVFVSSDIAEGGTFTYERRLPP